ncbi:MAG: CBS domain-containing protein [gamma proteobacterium endosymbiont of Lamellibrachia anaximandri]|nr:CBS domain-containing protein [gamma proteobacterium endosymbiont of Lamellibrachia anaximandri]
MTAESIMSFRLVKLKPTDKVCDALRVMHAQQIRNLPVVDENDQFVGLFGIRRLTRLLLPKAAQMNLGLQDLSFMPDEMSEMAERIKEVSQRPVSDFLEKKKRLMFCKPSTGFPEVLELLDQSVDTSLPVIVLKGKKKKLVGMVSAWDVVEKLLVNMCEMETVSAVGADDPEPGESEEEKAS